MKIKITFNSLPAGKKYMRLDRGKTKYYCGEHRLPKFLWNRL